MTTVYAVVVYREGLGKPPFRWMRLLRPYLLERLHQQGKVISKPRFSLEWNANDLSWSYLARVEIES